MFAPVFHLVSLHSAYSDLKERFIASIERQQKIPLILDEGRGLRLRNAVLLQPGECSVLGSISVGRNIKHPMKHLVGDLLVR